MGDKTKGETPLTPAALLPWVAGARLWVLMAPPGGQKQTSAPFS